MGQIPAAMLIIISVSILFVLSGCTSNEVICNPPYIRFGTGCCLDQNNNSICDEHENGTASTIVKTEKKSNIPDIPLLAECGNGKCEVGEDSSNCCIDCNCPTGFSCDKNSCKKLSVCGNGIQEEGETSENCCKDAGCPTGQTCADNTCVELKPVLQTNFYQTTESPSVTYLKAKGEGFASITIRNVGNDDALNVKVTLSSPNGYFAKKTIDFGTIPKNRIVAKKVDLTFLEKCLDVTADEKITIDADIIYSNSANIAQEAQESFNAKIAGRNYITWSNPEMIASWVTPTQPAIREFASKATSGLAAGMENSDPLIQLMAAQWLFESMRSYGVNYVNDAHSTADYIQFPYETLKNKAGDCEDNAVLYASLLESIGLKSFLVLIPGHIYSGYINSQGYAVPIETTASNFNTALLGGASEYASPDKKTIIYPTKSWQKYPQVNIPESQTLNMPSITKKIGKCEISFNLVHYFVASVDIEFINSGNAPGAGCAIVMSYQQGKLRDFKNKCWTLNPGEKLKTKFQPDIEISNGFSCAAY